MTKIEFMREVERQLEGLSAEDIRRSLEFYDEMISDRTESGEDEEAAVAAMGTPEAVARGILLDTPLPKLVRAKTSQAGKLRTWEIVLLALGSPLWIVLLAAAAAIIIAVFAVVWSIAVTLFALDVALAACSVGFVLASVLFFSQGAAVPALFVLGAALVCLGCALLLFFGCGVIVRVTLKLSARVLRAVKSLFVRRK